MKELIEALEDLMDVQNGAPLVTLEKDWNEAMEKAEKALQKAKQQPKLSADEFLKKYKERHYMRPDEWLNDWHVINLTTEFKNQ